MKTILKNSIKIALLAGSTITGIHAYANGAIVSKTVPKIFQGHWSAKRAKYCPKVSDGNLNIKSNKLIFWETTAEVVSVVVSNQEIVVTGNYTSEGETWLDSSRFELKNHDTLVTTLIDGSTMSRYRCFVK